MNSLDDKRYVISGGSGFLGISLATHLSDRGADVTIISRNKPRIEGPWKYESWDGRTLDSWANALNEADGMINLAGRTVDCIKTPDHRDEILRSRVESTRVLGMAIRQIQSPPTTWVQMSTAHIYGDPPCAVCDEDSAYGVGLAPLVAKAWEAEFDSSVLPNQRQVILRTSFVVGRNLGAGQGALGKLGLLARIGFGGKVAGGRQGMSWIHETDMNRLFERALCNDAMNGTYIASSPNPVSQQQFMRELRRAVGMPIGLPAFEWMVRIGAHWILRTDPELALYGRYLVSKRLRKEGFEFEHAEIRTALREIYS